MSVNSTPKDKTKLLICVIGENFFSLSVPLRPDFTSFRFLYILTNYISIFFPNVCPEIHDPNMWLATNGMSHGL